MSLRINNDPVVNGAAAEVSRSAQALTLSSLAGKSGSSSLSSGGDHFEVSSVTESISAGVNAQNLQRAARVSQLAKLCASGQYSVNSAQISSAIVGGAVTASRAGQA